MKKKNSQKYFENHNCEYFPCHNEYHYTKELNCKFCFCPLYHMEDCGGNYKTLENGLKDCSECFLPHMKCNYDYIINKIKEGKNND